MQNASICTSNEQTLTRTFSLVTIDNLDDVETILKAFDIFMANCTTVVYF